MGADRKSPPLPAARRRALLGLATALTCGELALSDGVDSSTAPVPPRTPGMGAGTAGYVSMRALHQPDAFPPTDLDVRQALRRLGHDGQPAAAAPHRTQEAIFIPVRSAALLGPAGR